jgi:ATP-dependent helicase HrpB
MDPAEIQSLPVYTRLDEIAGSLNSNRMLMLIAETGAGKTTLVPWKFLSHEGFSGKKILLLQPRRIAARAAADRIASLFGEIPGQTVGLRTRTETIIGKSTRLEVATEGILTRIVQNDQALEEYGTVIFDEFHERSLQADLALALAWDSRTTLRHDLKILFMSATLPAQLVRSALGDMKLISVPGRTHPVVVSYLPRLSNEKVWEGAARLAAEAKARLDASGGGDILVFLPGYYEISRTREMIEQSYPGLNADIAVLHGRIPPEEQRRVLNPRPASRSRIILSTNVAETSLTVPGVRAVVDTGLERRVRYQPRTGMDHWDTAPISAASSEQRKGRAGRTGPGICLRWWDHDDQRDDFSPPDILESDLAPLVLETALWGAASPFDLVWLTPPPQAAVERATSLLKELGLIDAAGRITPAGRGTAGMGLHPRLGRMIMEAAGRGWLASAAVAAAILEEGSPAGGNDPDFRDRIAAWSAWADGRPGSFPEGAARRIADEARRIIRLAGSEQRGIAGKDIDPDLAGKLLLLAYPDRAARRSSFDGNISRWLMVSGRGARMTGPLASHDFIAIADLDGGDIDARIFSAAPITIGDLESGLAGKPQSEYSVEWDGWIPRVRMIERLGRMKLREKQGHLPPEDVICRLAIDRIAREGIQCLPWNDSAQRLCARSAFISKHGDQSNWPDLTPDMLVREQEKWLIPFGKFNGAPVFTENAVYMALEYRLGSERRRLIDILAPEQIRLPSGTLKFIDYESGDIPIIAARLQEFFGSNDTPRLCGMPVMLHLLSPAGRPVQITRDLAGFWERSYSDVKKELMGRYPRHFWPDNPLDTKPTNRAKQRKGRNG